MFRIFDYKLWFIIGLAFIVLHLFMEITNLKNKLKLLEESNTITNYSPQMVAFDNSNTQQINNQQIEQTPQNTTIKIPEISEVNQNLELELPPQPTNTPQLKQEEQLQEEPTKQLEEKEEENNNDSDVNTEIPIYSNDNEDDELLSINVTEKINKMIKNSPKIKENETDTQDSPISPTTTDVIEVKGEEDKEEEQNLDDSEVNDIIKEDLEKMKKRDLEVLAEKYNLSTYVNNNGKMKKKTKTQIISDLVSKSF